MDQPQKRVVFDFEIDFSNGGGMQGQDFRLDLTGDDISDQELAAYIVKDMRLLMVGDVRILNKHIIDEPHKRTALEQGTRLIDLSHTIESGMITYQGLPAPIICDFLSREASKAIYAEGTTFQIGKIEMVTNTGTYIDCPFHRYEDGHDTSEVPLEHFVDLEGVVVRADISRSKSIDESVFGGKDLRGKAVLVHTGWDQHWRTDRYFHDHPHLTEGAARYLQASGARLVGIDSLNIDDTNNKERPVHTILLGHDILIVEHMCNLALLPDEGFSFSAVPPKFKGVGTFPVRALAKLHHGQ
jgi:arylformamidase